MLCFRGQTTTDMNKYPTSSYIYQEDGLAARFACPQDYQAIMDIDRDVYNGRDYLPALYHKFLKEPKRMCFVFEQDGVIVGFNMLYIVDSGQTVIRQAGRVVSCLRGQRERGPYGFLFRKMLTHATIVYPHLKDMTTAGVIWPGKENSSTYFPKRHVIKMCTNNSSFKEQAIRPPLSGTDGRVYEPVSKARLAQIISNQPGLFPSGGITRIWEPFKLEPTNIPLIVDRVSMAIACRDITKPSDVTGYHNDVTSLSFGAGYYCKAGYMYEFDYYGSDEDEAVQHFMLHAHAQGRHIRCEVISAMTVPISFQPETIKRKINSICPFEDVSNFKYNAQYFATTPLKSYL